MGRYILVSIIFLFANSIVQSQNRINLNIGYGYYLSNSENSMKIMGDKKFRSIFLLGFSYQKEDVFGYNLMLDYNYHKIDKNNVINFVRTGESSPEPIGSFGGNMSLVSHNIDLNYVGDIIKNISYGIGPSIFFVNRIFEISDVSFGIYDKLASSGLGINGFLMFNTPIFENSNFSFTSKIKFRYTHSIWFDEGIRNLDEYSQEFVTAQINVGLGYSF